MQYYVIGNDGNKYGPADVPTLKGWIAENRLSPDSMLEDFNTGQRIPASQVAGLFDSQGAPTMTAQPGAAPTGNMYENPPQPIQGYYQRPGVGSADAQSDFTKALVFSILGMICCPIIFGVLGIVYANKAKEKGHPSGQAIFIFSIVAICIGIGVGVLSRVFFGGLGR